MTPEGDDAIRRFLTAETCEERREALEDLFEVEAGTRPTATCGEDCGYCRRD